MARRHRPGLDPAPKPISEIVERAVERSEFERTARMVNKKRFCELTGFDRKTLDDWLSKGCPSVGESGKGAEILVDIRKVWEWREEQVAKKAMKDAMGDGSEFIGFMGIRDPVKAIMAQEKYIKLGILKGQVVEYEQMLMVMERFFGVVRNTVMGIPERIFREMKGFPADRTEQWRLDALRFSQEAMDDGRQILVDGMPPEPEDDD